MRNKRLRFWYEVKRDSLMDSNAFGEIFIIYYYKLPKQIL